MTFNPFPDFGRGADEAATLAGLKAFKTPLPEYLGAQVREGFWATIPGQAIAQGNRAAAEVEGETPMTAEEWRQSPSFRPTIPFDEKMTPSRAQATAETFDENAYRRWLIDQRKAGPLDGTLGFIAGIAGSAPDPVNFIPWIGPAFRAARVARYGVVAGRAIAGAAEGAIGTAVAQPFLVTSRNQFGDDVGFADVAMDIAFGAFAGAAIGGGVGVWKRFRGERTGLDDLKVAPRETLADPVPDVPRQNVALYNLDTAARNVAEGRPVDIDPRASAEMASLRSTYEAAAKEAVLDGVTFETAKGSKYRVEVDGSTTRDKAYRPEHGVAEQGIQPTSQTTFYVAKSDVEKLGLFQTEGNGKKAIVAIGEGRYAVKYLDGKDAGKFERRTIVEAKTNPAVGLIPVELWNDGARVHFGNEIVKVTPAAVSGKGGSSRLVGGVSPDRLSRHVGDTGPSAFGRAPDGHNPNAPQTARPVNFDTAAPDRLPEAADPAPKTDDARVALTDDTLAKLDEADELVKAGRLTEADAATIKAARAELTRTEAYDKAAPAAAFCFRG